MTRLYYVIDNKRNVGLINSYYKFMIFDNLLAAQQRADNINEREQDNIARINAIDISFDYKNGLWVLYYNGGYEFFENTEAANNKLIYYYKHIQQQSYVKQHVHVHSHFNIWHAHQ
jgi:hypothetical protein